MARSKRSVVARDLFVGASSVVTATLIAGSLDGPSAWPLGLGVAAVGIVLFAAADRTTAVYGLAAGVTGSIGALGVALWLLIRGSPVAVFPPLLFGLGVGTVANRLLFGVVYPLPEQRRRRENLT